jgi:hypothetical protein
VGKLKIVKNWLAKPRRTPCLAFLPDFSAIIRGKVAIYTVLPFFVVPIDTGDRVQSKIRRLNRIFRPRIPAIFGLTGLKD